MTNKSTAFAKNLNMLNIIGLRESIETLMAKEGKYAPVALVCKAYLKKLDEGLHEGQVCTSFVNELTRVAIHESSKDVVFNLGNKINEHKRDIDIVNNLLAMQQGRHSYVVPMVESALVDYMTNKNAETRTTARKSLSLFEGIAEINGILEALSFDEYEEKTNKKLVNSSLNESFIPKEPETFTKEQVDKMLEDAKATVIKEQEAPVSKSINGVDSHIYLDNTIKSILKKNTTNNEGLKAFCEQYIQALNAGKPEEILYESFISGVSHWNHLSAVDTELSALNDRISKYQQEVNLKKILKVMESTGSYYIVPLIESCVVDYIENKTMANKAVLKQRLQAFEYDPFVRDILNIVMHDQSLEANVYLGESLESVNNYVHTEKVFSPVKYIKENECIFNVKGTYYNRKGNTITKLSKSSIEKLDESFKTLCNLINHPAVSIDDLSNSITIYEGKDSAKISESSIILNGNEVTVDEIDNIAHMSNLMNENKQGFYAAVKMINEKFDEIAYIDFVKRVAMNESNGKTVDVFRIKNNLFVATNDVKLGSSTFYRNVNPIQCRSYINEHMSLNVSPLFEDILPNQKAILEGVEEAKKEYETYIEDLKNKKKEFEAMRGECEGADADIDKAISIIDDDIADMEKDYEKYKKDTEKYMTGDDDDAEKDSPDNVAANYGVDNTEEPNESPEDMEVPIAEEPAAEEPAAEDPAMDADVAAMADELAAEDDAIASATPYDSDFDVVSPEIEDKGGVKVLRVSYAENVKTGKKLNKGTAFVVIPSVDANGDVKDETKSITFYLDADRKPIINNEYMPLIIYKSIVDAISADPDTANIDVNGTAEVDTPADSVEVTTSITATTPTNDTDAVVDDPAADIADSIVEPTNDTEDDTEPMAGLEADPDAPSDTVSNTSTDGKNASGDDNTLDIDSMIDSIGNTDFEDDDENDIDSELDRQLDNFLGSEDGDKGEDIPAAKQETPAETASRTDSETYPIELGLNTEDIKPISKGRFTEACKEMGIECSTVEGQNDCVTLKFKNKAEVYAMQDYFKDWKNYSQAQFCNFFPELKKCFDNKPQVPVAAQKVSEGFSILGVRAINESVLYSDSKKGTVNIVIPYTEDYAKMFGYSTGKRRPSHINIITESYAETADLYKTLSSYASAKGNKIDEDTKSFLNRYSKDFENLTESNIYSLTVPYNNFLEQKLEHKGIVCSRVNEGLSISLHKDEYAKAKKVFESVYGEKTPVSVKDFFHLADSSLDEGLKITVKDDKTGKTVEFDLDDLTGKGKDSEDADSPADEQKNFDDAFKDVTFNSKDSELFNVGDEDSDDEKDDEKSSEEDNKSDDEQDNEQLEIKKDSEEKDSESKDEEKPAKKKFMFRKKKNESVTSPSFKNPLNESTCCSATPNVLDWVKLSDGNVAQVIATLPMTGNFIVNLNGRTVEVSPNNLVLACCKKDLVDVPHKFDKATLKLLSESMVRCGMFVNNNQITPNGCYVKYGDFVNAKNEDQIRIVVEGESVLASKKYIKILENINSFAIPSGFVSAEEISEIGVKLRDILVNIKEFEAASAATDPVTAMIYNNATGEYESYVLPKESIRLSAV